MTTGTADKLHRLHQLILAERDCAKKLDLEGLQQVSREKEVLVTQLPRHEELSDELRALAETLRKENRRNAYLFWSALGWVRESMQFFNRQATQPSYSASGRDSRVASGGRLLSGKV